ncbi:MAG: hypothetical protein JSS11_00770 [Verrucomicrobia bacterium]|nr:hypothetical protein [Verrucomicrobiota bacterium]
MKTLLLIVALAAGPVYGEEPPQTLSEKVRARLFETAPPPASVVVRPGPVKKPDPVAESDEVVVLHPMIVRAPFAQREFDAFMERQEKRAAAERFTLIKGGTIYQSKDGRFQVGAWGELGGWALLKFKW